MSADFWSSYLSGAIGILIGNPLDVIKTRLQASSTPSPSPPPTTISPPRHFTTPLSYLAGTPFPLLGYGALNAILFTTYNRTLQLLGERTPSAPCSLAKVWVAGAVGGLATFVVSAPTELVKCRAQVLRREAAGAPVEHSSWGIARDVWRREGLRGLYFGGGVTSVRDAVGYGFYFWSYELCKQSWPKQSSPSPSAADVAAPKETALQVLVCGGIAGITTWLSIYPLDMIKTRVQTQPFETKAPALVNASECETEALLAPRRDAAERRMKGAVELARATYRAEGLAPFFRGLGVCSVRAFIVNAVTWLVYERTMDLLNHRAT